ncbi:MBL fold metallo-hydrolase [Amycolatopsis cynarae]|uniref:MBL fold metallo-hydrolase n=1 Tax=Amycolatopsis cynarae TaxID=2995223 RepID=A0ABY7BAY1_9PSEU|nr:MBL fold metallo-hydrolase [Amycolatopsis sp. HUAS 11-8]WAL69104.1 MBL fold metallo-hydrolase [Amycolatopsis sp. HUAS 11-8]
MAGRRPLSRRSVLRTAGALAAGEAVVAPGTARAEARRTHGATLHLLGTAGGPPPVVGRRGISSALVVNGRTYLVDLGYGSYEQFHLAGLAGPSLAGVFVTHLHSDHIADLFQLFWLRGGGPKPLAAGVPVWGPGPAGALPPVNRDVPVISPGAPAPGLAAFVDHNIRAAAYDLNVRIRDEGFPDIHRILLPREIAIPPVGASATARRCPPMEPFLVMENGDCRVSATLVDHPPVFPSFAYRFDTDHGSVVFSGDTTVNDNLVRLARNADILVHEVISLEWMARQGFPEALRAHLKQSHTDANLVGAVAERADARRLVLSHLVPGEPAVVGDQEWRLRAAHGYSGEVVVGRDLMVLPLG